MANFFDQFDVAEAPPSNRPKITVTPLQKAFLNSVSAGEAPDYNTMYGGGRFEAMQDHPRQAVPIRSGPNAGKTSSAAGRYQFLQGTWDEAKNALGLPDFSPDSQDAAATWLAERDYAKRTNGRNLWDDIESAKDNPAKLNFIAGALSKTWTSLPGGAEPNRASAGFSQRLVSELSAQAKKPPSGNFFDQFDNQPEMQGPPQRQVGVGEAIGRGVQQGASFNLSDELAGLKAASGIPETIRNVASAIPIANLIAPTVGAARMGYEALTGGNQATESYNQAVEAERAANKLAQEQRPYSTVAGNIAGALVLPVGGVMNAATLPARMGAGAAVGAATGALAGAGEGDGIADRASRATVGGALGGVIGGVAPPVVEGAIQLGRSATVPLVNAMRGAINPEAEASRRVANVIARDIQNDPGAVSRLTPQEFTASVQQGGPATIMDIGGEGTRALARSAANTSPEGRQVLNQAINDRYEGQSGRVIEWLRNTFHFPNADAQQRALEQTARNVNRAAYARAYQDGAGGVWSSELERLAGSDAVTSAMQRAAAKARDESIIGGYGAMNPRVTFRNGILEFQRGRNGMPLYPDLQYWDLVRRELSDAAQNAGRGTSEARRLNSFATALNSELDRLVPSYQQARQGAAGFFGAENALEAGQNFVAQNFGAAETRRALARMNPQERQLFQDGFVSRYVETLERTGDRRNVLNQIASSPAAREKLNLALGRQRAAELEAGLRVEGIMDMARGAVQGNSTTARQLAELGLAGGTGATGIAGVYNQDPQTMTLAAVSAALLAGRRGIDTRVARQVATLLVSDDPQRLMQGIRIVARNDRFMDGLRVADRKIAAVGSAETPKGIVPIQAMSAGRAEDQPSVDGPRRQ